MSFVFICEGEFDRHLANDAPPPARPGVDWARVLEEKTTGTDLPLEVARLTVVRWETVRGRLDAARSKP
jgi:hypothetical protein